MDESELIREAYEFLGRGRFEAAEMRFGEYMARRVRVVGEEELREAWAKGVAEKRVQVAAQEEHAARQKKGGWRRGIKSP